MSNNVTIIDKADYQRDQQKKKINLKSQIMKTIQAAQILRLNSAKKRLSEHKIGSSRHTMPKGQGKPDLLQLPEFRSAIRPNSAGSFYRRQQSKVPLTSLMGSERSINPSEISMTECDDNDHQHLEDMQEALNELNRELVHLTTI